MAVFRVEKNKGYTVMSNHHLRNIELTLKAKGLLSQMLSLPETWDYTFGVVEQLPFNLPAGTKEVPEMAPTKSNDRILPLTEEEEKQRNGALSDVSSHSSMLLFICF